MTTDCVIRSRPQTLNRFLKATLEGIKYAKANPDFTIETLGKYTRNTATELLASALQSYVLGYIRNVPTVTGAEVEGMMEDIAARNPKAKGLDPRRFYDPAPLELRSQEGSVKELYPR